MAKLTDQIINGQRVIRVETEDEFLYYLGQEMFMECPPGMAEKLGFTDEISPEELEAELQGEREWEELQARWAAEECLPGPELDPSSPFSQGEADAPAAVVIPFPPSPQSCAETPAHSHCP